jgi:PHD/YefM family antitoxin component YafN of YafNO toxin-antitoxin module
MFEKVHMINLHPQYINDTKGNKSMVVLSIQEFELLMEELEELKDTRLYDEARKADTARMRIYFIPNSLM